jgi:hypothetical protein
MVCYHLSQLLLLLHRHLLLQQLQQLQVLDGPTLSSRSLCGPWSLRNETLSVQLPSACRQALPGQMWLLVFLPFCQLL